MTRAFRVLRLLVGVFLLNLSLSVALSQAALPLTSKGRPVMASSSGLNMSLERRVRASRRLERARRMHSVLPESPWTQPQHVSFSLPARASEPYAVSAAPPDHPPA